MIIKSDNMVLDLLVQTDPEGIVALESEVGVVRMIPFSGTVSYMLTGTDHTGAPCHIYVQNEAWFTDGARPRPWHSVPTFITDSKTLAPILHHHSFIGEGIRDDEGLHIRFYKVAEE